MIIPSIEPKKEPIGPIKPKPYEEEVSGINLSKLFSVYGAQSTLDKKKVDGGQQPEETEDEDSDEEDEEPLIIQLMESMFTRKKTV